MKIFRIFTFRYKMKSLNLRLFLPCVIKVETRSKRKCSAFKMFHLMQLGVVLHYKSPHLI